MTSIPSKPLHDSDEQRLQFHLQLMGRRHSSRPDLTLVESHLSPSPSTLLPRSITPTCRFSDPLDPLSADSSPYHHAMLFQPSTSTCPSSGSASSTLSSSPHHVHPPAPPLPIYSLTPSLSPRRATFLAPYPSPALLCPTRRSSSQSIPSFDPDYEAEKVRLAKLEQRRSVALANSRPTLQSSRASSASSIASVRSFRSVGLGRSNRSPLFGLPSSTFPVYRPSPLRSTSTPDLGIVETEAEKKRHRKEMKEEYDKMRAARIQEEKQLQARVKSGTDDRHQNWFSSRFKRSTAPRPDEPVMDERRSTSLSSSLDSTVPASSTLDHRSDSAGTAATSEDESFQAIGKTHKSEESLENVSDQSSSFDSPVVDPFRKSVLPGQVPPTPTKITLLASTTPKSIRILTPGRTGLHKLNRLFDSLKLGGGAQLAHHHPQQENQENKKETQSSTLESHLTNSGNTITPDQAGWLGSIKSVKSKPRSSRRKSLMGMFFTEKELPPPVPKLPDHIST